jgi:hypothetical protein
MSETSMNEPPPHEPKAVESGAEAPDRASLAPA